MTLFDAQTDKPARQQTGHATPQTYQRWGASPGMGAITYTLPCIPSAPDLRDVR